jgi:hypothetical protein
LFFDCELLDVVEFFILKVWQCCFFGQLSAL